MANDTRAAGMAAIAVCESLLLSLTEGGVLEPAEARSILTDAASAHRNAASTADNPTSHQQAADLIDRIVRKQNSIGDRSR